MAIELTLQQNQILSPRMLQSVQILQMSADELDSYIEDASLENPTMDIKAKPTESITAHQWEYRAQEEAHYQTQRKTDDDYDPRDTWNFRTREEETLIDHVWSQLISYDFSPRSHSAMDFMIRSLDNHGYLTVSQEEVCQKNGISEKTFRKLLALLQSLEPIGVGARDLRDCLLIQLRQTNRLTPVLETLIRDHLDLVAKSKHAALAKELRVSAREAETMCHLIRSLNPTPASGFSNNEEVHYLIPDVSIVEDHGHFTIVLNESVYPDITVNTYYRSMYDHAEDGEVREYLQQKIAQTEWVNQCLMQRRHTITSVTETILKFQHDFFAINPQQLHPLGQTEVAQELGIHESTVSRAIDNKFLQCKWGVFPLSHFFPRNAGGGNRGFTVGNSTGFTSMEVKQALRELVDGENKKKPYSDRILSELLTEKGLTISRRTVAKYREEEGIPDASGRKNN